MFYSYSTNIEYVVHFQSSSTPGEVLYLKFYIVFSSAQNLRQGIVTKTSFETPGFHKLGQAVL